MLDNPIAYNSLYSFLQALLELVILIAFPALVLFLVYVGYLFVAAQGNPEKIKEARSFFLWAVVGGLIILGAQALSFAIEATINQLTP